MSGSLTDIAGIRVGHAEDARALSGVTAIVFDTPMVAAVDIRGGGPGTRETDLLDPERTVPGVDALVLSGGSVFGLDAASGVTAWLAETGRGFAVGPARVPIVPAAILFDLLNGGDKAWGRYPPYRDLGFAAAAAPAPVRWRWGRSGPGSGAHRQPQGGLGQRLGPGRGHGVRVAALVAVNALGRVTVGDGPHFWAGPFEEGPSSGAGPRAENPARRLRLADEADARRQHDDRGGRHRCPPDEGRGPPPRRHGAGRPRPGDRAGPHAAGRRPGLCRRHGCRAARRPVGDLARLGDAAARVLARAVALGVYRASALPVAGAQAAWRDRFGR